MPRNDSGQFDKRKADGFPLPHHRQAGPLRKAHRHVRAALATVAVTTALLAGCEPARPLLFDAESLTAARRVVVLPLADAPGPQGTGTGRAVVGVIVGELVEMGRFDVINVTDESLQEALEATGYSLADRYDPSVASAVGKQMGADLVVSGEVVHYAAQKEHSSTAVLITSGGQTETTHWVSLSLRIVRSGEAQIVYAGEGTASSKEGYTPAAVAAAGAAMASLRYFVENIKQ